MNTQPPQADPRWDDRVPWDLRNPQVTIPGDVQALFRAIGQRLNRFLLFNESGLSNVQYFGTYLTSETLGHFQYEYAHIDTVPAAVQAYFDVSAISKQSEKDCESDAEENELRDLHLRQRFPKFAPGIGAAPSDGEVLRAEAAATRTRPHRLTAHWEKRVAQRVATLEAIFYTVIRIGGNVDGLTLLILDIRRFCAAHHVPLDIRGQPPRIVPMEERLLQESVIDPLLGRLEARWPQRAKELVIAYHDMLAGKPFDEVFSDAFKSVEEIARSLTGDPKFEFSDGDLQRAFPEIHGTIRATMSKLRAHRGDEASHGRKAPDPYEIRYLLFQLCNVALLLLDYDAMTAAHRGAMRG